MTRLNFTGRKKIRREAIKFRIEENGSLLFNAETIELGSLSLPSDAQIVIEAQRQTRFMRLSGGTVGNPKLPKSSPLSEFDGPEGLRFRVKVVGASKEDDGKILAAADGVTATTKGDNSGRTSLLPIRPVELGQLLWRLEIIESPLLLVNKNVDDWHQLARQPYFQALVFPEVIRQIAIWLIHNLNNALDNPDSAAAKWLMFFKESGSEAPEVAADLSTEGVAELAEEWADDVAEKFGRKHKFLDKLMTTEGDK